jgi:hypothetical protein
VAEPAFTEAFLRRVVEVEKFASPCERELLDKTGFTFTLAYNIIRIMKEELVSQINSLRAQVSVLAAQVKKLEGTSSLGELYGLLRGQSETTEDEIAKVQYRLREAD